jgi:hypothetical protein
MFISKILDCGFKDAVMPVQLFFICADEQVRLDSLPLKAGAIRP